MTTQTDDKHLKLLNEDEIAILFACPIFTHDERQQYFSLSPVENAVLKGLFRLTKGPLQITRRDERS